MLRRKIALALVNILVLLAFSHYAERATATSAIGAHWTYSRFKTTGLYELDIREPKIVGLEILSKLGKRFAFVGFFETSGQEFIAAGGAVQYFPFSVGLAEESRDHVSRVLFDDGFKLFLTADIEFGKMRVASSFDTFDAAEYSPAFYGFDAGIGVLQMLSRSVGFALQGTYGRMQATNDATISFAATRTAARLTGLVFID